MFKFLHGAATEKAMLPIIWVLSVARQGHNSPPHAVGIMQGCQ